MHAHSFICLREALFAPCVLPSIVITCKVDTWGGGGGGGGGFTLGIIFFV